MTEQFVITEKTSQAKDVRAAVGSRYGAVLAAEGHLFDLQEPEDVVPAWKRWTAVLLRPDALYGTRPAAGGNKAAKLKAIRDALRSARRVWLATDCDREGQLIGQEILEHLRFRGEVMRVMFTAQDPQTIRDAFARTRPNRDFASLYAAAVARRQADQIYNLSLTRTATVVLASGQGSVIGIGRVKTPTLAIVCRRELEIRSFVPEPYHEVVVTASVAAGQFRMRYAPRERIGTRQAAEAIAAAAEGYEGPLGVVVEDKRQAPPRLQTCRPCRSCAARGSAGQPPRRWRSRRSSTTAPARRWLLLGSGVVAAPSCDQARNQGAEQGFAASASVMDELEEAEVERQLVLRDVPVRAQPGAQQRPETLDGVDVDLAKTVAVLVAGVFAAPMADRLVPVAPSGRRA